MSKNIDRKCYMSSLLKKVMIHCSACVHLTKVNETESTSKLNRSEQNQVQALNLVNMFGELKDSATKTEIIATLKFVFKMCPIVVLKTWQEQLPDTSIAKLLQLDLLRCHI